MLLVRSNRVPWCIGKDTGKQKLGYAVVQALSSSPQPCDCCSSPLLVTGAADALLIPRSSGNFPDFWISRNFLSQDRFWPQMPWGSQAAECSQAQTTCCFPRQTPLALRCLLLSFDHAGGCAHTFPRWISNLALENLFKGQKNALCPSRWLHGGFSLGLLLLCGVCM